LTDEIQALSVTLGGMIDRSDAEKLAREILKLDNVVKVESLRDIWRGVEWMEGFLFICDTYEEEP